MEQSLTLDWYEYLIFAILLALSLAIGIYFAFTGGKQSTVKEYLVGSRQLAMFPVASSIAMSTMSAILVLGSVAEFFKHGIERFAGDIWTCIGVMSVVGLVPLFYRLKLTSVFEYVKIRFESRTLELVCAVMLIIGQIFYVGLAIYAPSTAMESVTSVPYWVILVISGTVGIIYTTIGGMKTVVWTDLIQGIILILGLVVIIVMGTLAVGGVGPVYNAVYNSGRLHSVSYSADPRQRTNLWASIAYGFFQGVVFGSMQTTVQRLSSTPSLREAKGTLYTSVPIFGLGVFLTSLCGVVVFAHYQIIGCDPLKTGQIRTSNQLLPFFVTNGLRIPGLPGILMAVLFSGALSSVSSSMSAMSTVTWKHMLEYRFRHISEARKTFVTKSLACMYGCLGVGFSFVVHAFGGNILQVTASIISSSNAPLAGTILLGALTPFGNWKGALSGCVLTFPIMMVWSLGNSFYNPHRGELDTTTADCHSYNLTLLPSNSTATDDLSVPTFFRISPQLFLPIGLAIYMTVGVVVSLATGGLQQMKHIRRNIYVSWKDFLCVECVAELDEGHDSTNSHGFDDYVMSLPPKKLIDANDAFHKGIENGAFDGNGVANSQRVNCLQVKDLTRL